MSNKLYNDEDNMDDLEIPPFTITDDMGENSDFGGDSDAEEIGLYSTSSSDTSPSNTPIPMEDPKKNPTAFQRPTDTMVVDDDDSVIVSYDIPSPMNELNNSLYYDTAGTLNTSHSILTSTDTLNSSTLHYLLTENQQHVDETEKIQNWTKIGRKPQRFSQITFKEPYGPSDTVAIDLEDPFSIFKQFFTEKLITSIVNESNLYATQNGVQLDLTNEEFFAFTGVLLIMGFHTLPNLRLYWSSDINFHVQRIADVMCLKRFLKIFRYLHLNDNSKMPKRGSSEFNVLYKVFPLVEELNRNFKKIFTPNRYIAIGESMVRLNSTESCVKKATKRNKTGFKVLALCCTQSGYALNLSVCTGKIGENYDSNRVENLIAPYLHKGYCLVFGNSLLDAQLSKFLLENNTFSVGTIRSNSKHYPHCLKPAKDMNLMELDFAQCGDVAVIKWKDRCMKSISVITTVHCPMDSIKINRHSKDGTVKVVNCPQAIVDYNNRMAAVDRFDLSIEANSLSCVSRRWWMRIFFYFLDASIVNSYVVYREKLILNKPELKPISQIMFRSKLATNLIGKFSSRQKQGLSPNIYFGQARKKHRRDQLKSVLLNKTTKFSDLGSHLPIKGTSRRCAFCSTAKKSKRSQIICKKCEVALCLECFTPFHEN